MPPDPLEAILNDFYANAPLGDLAYHLREPHLFDDLRHAAIPDRYIPGDCDACDGWHPDGECPAELDVERDHKPMVNELNQWRANYGRLDIPVTVIDWRPIYAGAAALGIALVARWVVRHGR